MSGFGQKYVVDTNTLSQIGKRRRVSDFFRTKVLLPEEVLREASMFPDIGELRTLVYPTTSHVLELLIRVMASVPTDDTKLVNLFSNKGSADPMLIACALDGQWKDSSFLDAPEWVVVTADEAVHKKAEQYGLMALTNAEFAALIDADQTITQDVNTTHAHLENRQFTEITGASRLDVRADDERRTTCVKCGSACLPEAAKPKNRFTVVFVCPTHGEQRGLPTVGGEM